MMMKKNFDRRSLERDFYLGDLVLKWDVSKANMGKHGTFENSWIDPYLISFIQGNNKIILVDMDGGNIKVIVNDKILKHFFEY